MRELTPPPARAWCWGAGWDSTAGIIEDVRRGVPIDMITFADHGGEKRFPDPDRGEEIGTYDFIPVFTSWLTERGYPAPVICRYRPRHKTHSRYADAVRRVVDRLRLSTITDDDVERLSGIYGNMLANETLPGLAFGMKSCSVKWKIEAQEPYRVAESSPLRATWDRGQRVENCIGFDATEHHRVKGGGAYAVGNFSICNRAGLPKFSDRYRVRYPLRDDYGFDRAKCRQVIASAGLPIPPKSACFFCPAMRQIEIERLKKTDPDFHRLAVEMERIYRSGRHFRGDGVWSVKGRRKDTGEVQSFDCTASSAAEARKQFRRAFDDTSRPYKFAVREHQAVPGLGRSFAWSKEHAP